MVEALDTELVAKVDKVLAKLEEFPEVREAFRLLKEELPSRFTFHSYSHTEDVLREAILFAVLADRDVREIELLGIAAAFHDVGFITCPEDHEALSAKTAGEAMEKSGKNSPEEISLVEAMIQDTKIVDQDGRKIRVASSELSKYLLDADVSNFGRDDFFERLEAHCRELGCDSKDHLEQTRDLMLDHTWFTEVAGRLRQSKKESNLLMLNKRIDNLS
jgi:predicted metal-dependent HD superfamily phosphohydrolase